MATDNHKSLAPCAICGAVGFHTSYFGGKGSVKERMDRDGTCFSCAHWAQQADRDDLTIINGWVYGPGNRTSGEFRGMAGRRFDIEYSDGRRITTFDLWSGGEIPEHFRAKMPNNAKFLNGAERAKVGEINCWSPADSKTPPYPLPKDNLPKAKAEGK